MTWTASKTVRAGREARVLKSGRKQPDAEIGVLQQLRRLVSARSGSQRRGRLKLDGLANQPVEVCEARAMLAAFSADPTNDFDVAYSSVVNADFNAQITNALEFIDSNSNGGVVTIFVDGQQVELTDLLTAGGSALDLYSHLPTTVGSNDRDIPVELDKEDLLGIPDRTAAPPLSADLPVVDSEDYIYDEFVAVDEHWDTDNLSGLDDWQPVDELPTSTPVPDGSAPEPDFEIAADSGVDSDIESPAVSDSDSNPPLTAEPSTDSERQSDTDGQHGVAAPSDALAPVVNSPTTITTVIETDSGILVLHQTSVAAEVGRSPGLASVRRFIDAVAREFQLARNQLDTRPADLVSAVVPPVAIESLDSVFSNSGRLFHDLQDKTRQYAVNAMAFVESDEASSAAVSDQAALPIRARSVVPRTDWSASSHLVRRIQLWLSKTALHRRFAAATSLMAQAVDDNVDSIQRMDGNRAQFYRDVLSTQRYWLPTSRDEEQVQAVLLSDLARHAAQPADAGADFRNSTLYRSLSLLTSLFGESPVTVPRRLPEHPPEIPEMVCQTTSLLYSINPRGPPDSESSTGFARQEAIRFQHQMLKHSIAPRSPSICFFA